MIDRYPPSSPGPLRVLRAFLMINFGKVRLVGLLSPVHRGSRAPPKKQVMRCGKFGRHLAGHCPVGGRPGSNLTFKYGS